MAGNRRNDDGSQTNSAVHRSEEIIDVRRKEERLAKAGRRGRRGRRMFQRGTEAEGVAGRRTARRVAAGMGRREAVVGGARAERERVRQRRGRRRRRAQRLVAQVLALRHQRARPRQRPRRRAARRPPALRTVRALYDAPSLQHLLGRPHAAVVVVAASNNRVDCAKQADDKRSSVEALEGANWQSSATGRWRCQPTRGLRSFLLTERESLASIKERRIPR